MKASIIRIGNSKGIRIPKVMLEQTRLSGEVEMEARDQQIVIRPLSSPRQGWEEKFRTMCERGDDKLLDADLAGQTSWDKEEWLWK